MFGNDEMYAALNVTSIKAVIDADATTGSGKALYSAMVIPQDITAIKTINFYRSIPSQPGISWGEYGYSVNCRGSSYQDSLTIAKAVFTEIDRKSYTDYYLVSSVLPTIPPADDRDVYNTPIEVILKRRQ